MKKIYFNKELVKSYPHTPFLAPLLWIYNYKEGSIAGMERKMYDTNELQERAKKWKSVIEYASIKDCDFVVYPKNFAIDLYSELKKEALEAKKYNKNIVVFFDTDIEAPIPGIDNMIVFRCSLTQDSPKNEYSLPYFCPEIVVNTKLPISKEVSIWYVWYGRKISLILRLGDKIRNFKPIKRFLYRLVYSQTLKHLIKDKWCINPSCKMTTLAFPLLQVGKWDIVRRNAVKHLEKSKYKFNFIRRDKVLNPKVGGSLRDEYISNMVNSTFVLVARWFWNNAYRLYETMSLWKIPLLIDTSIKLPFENEINYRDLFIRVPYSDIKNVDKYIDIYLEKNINDLDKIGERIKNIFEDNLRMYPFFRKTVENIEDYFSQIEK